MQQYSSIKHAAMRVMDQPCASFTGHGMHGAGHSTCEGCKGLLHVNHQA